MFIYPSESMIAGRYEVVQGPLEKPSLAGGMGLVYLCVDHRENERPVALKTFRPELLSNRTARDRFLREGTTWMQLGKYPHIVQCHNVIKFEFGSEVFFVLELVNKADDRNNASLRSWLIAGKPLSIDQSLIFALHIARGMKHAVSKITGIVHRDLKPENILVGQDGLAKVTDFGLATALGVENNQWNLSNFYTNDEISLERTQLTHGIVGTPLYMAPEQWEGAELDERTDIYAFGCILNEMLTGNFAFFEKNLKNLEKAHRTGRFRKLPLGLHTDIVQLRNSCIAKNREERYPSWKELEVELTNLYKKIIGKDAPQTPDSLVETRAERVALGWSYNSMGLSYRDIGKFEVAREYFNRATKISRTEKELRMEIMALSNLGNVYLHIGDTDQAIKIHEQSLVLAREIGERVAEGMALNNLGNAYNKLGRTNKAIECYEMRIQIAREVGDRHGEGNALGNLGNVYFQSDNFRYAIDYHEKRLAIMREIDDLSGEGESLGNLGAVYGQLHDMQRSIRYYERCLIIMRKLGNPHGQLTALAGISAAYSELGDYWQAINYLEQRLNVAREIHDQRGEWSAIRDMGYAYLKQGNYNLAIDFYEQAIDLAHGIGDTVGAARDSFTLSILLSHTGRTTDALSKAEYALEIFEKFGHEEYAANARKLIHDFREKL
ncbi:MAG: hypothetical protein CV087_16050 [Candidatus Brocadia sp. WS118]|nr:MAG: hypothetical protein CV087_16050 [Candidatus Brocadia sp. WS118]